MTNRNFHVVMVTMLALALPGVVYAEAVGATGSLDAYGLAGPRLLRMSVPSKAVVGVDEKDRTAFTIEAQRGSVGRVEVNASLSSDSRQLSWADVHGSTKVFITKDGKTYSCKLTDGFPGGFICPVGLNAGQTATVGVETGITANWNAKGFYVWISDANQGLLEEPLKGTGAATQSILPLADAKVSEALAPGDCLATRDVSGMRPDGTSYNQTTTDIELCS